MPYICPIPTHPLPLGWCSPTAHPTALGACFFENPMELFKGKLVVTINGLSSASKIKASPSKNQMRRFRYAWNTLETQQESLQTWKNLREFLGCLSRWIFFKQPSHLQIAMCFFGENDGSPSDFGSKKFNQTHLEGSENGSPKSCVSILKGFNHLDDLDDLGYFHFGKPWMVLSQYMIFHYIYPLVI